MPQLTINGIPIEVAQGLTLMQACEQAGVEIPHFCYHERLSIAGNCRMCLVELKGSHKPIASCAMAVRDGMEVTTDSEVVRKARHGVMEFLLANHPLDCPICDQGGECDLQDQAVAYGRSYSRFHEEKRAFADDDWGPLIKTHMTRCIHCMRCVRFATEVAGVEEIGSLGRGEETQIIPTIEKTLTSELSGNIIDLCPVGALTSKPYAYKARPWELQSTYSIDVMDAMGSHIQVDARGREVMRVLPRECPDINEEWISDTARFSYDGLALQRLDRPWVREEGRLRSVSWERALEFIEGTLKKKADGARMAALAGDLCCGESMMVLGDILDFYNCPHRDCRQDGALFDGSQASGYVFGGGFACVDETDACLLVGCDLRHDAPLLHSRLLRRVMHDDIPLAFIGQRQIHDIMPYQHLGEDTDALLALHQSSFSQSFHKSQKPMLMVGMDAFTMPQGMAMHHVLYQVAQQYELVRDDWWGFNVVHRAAARVAGLALNFLPRPEGWHTQTIVDKAQKGECDILWLLAADEALPADFKKNPNTCIIYLGHHGDNAAHHADVILPTAAYTEKNATYINSEGRVQQTHKAVAPPGLAQEDWMVLAEIARRLKISLNYHDKPSLRQVMSRRHPLFSNRDRQEKPQWGAFGAEGNCSGQILRARQTNFYLSNAILRASPVMASCARLVRSS